MRVPLAFLDVALDVLNHHDGVVDDKSCSQGDAKQSQGVNGKSEQFDEGERPHERNRDSHGRNDGTAPVFQENENHQDNQHDGLNESAEHIFDGLTHRVGGVKRQVIDHARREMFGEPFQFCYGCPIHL